MPRRRPKHVEQTTLDSMEVMVIMLEQEARNVENAVPDLRAADMNCMSADEEITSSTFLFGIAKWLREVIQHIRR